jgi:hypothetical protein
VVSEREREKGAERRASSLITRGAVHVQRMKSTNSTTFAEGNLRNLSTPPSEPSGVDAMHADRERIVNHTRQSLEDEEDEGGKNERERSISSDTSGLTGRSLPAL